VPLGEHDTKAEIIEKYLDWCDLHFGRANKTFPQVWHFPYKFDDWKKHNKIIKPKPVVYTDVNSLTLKKWKSGQKDRENRIRFLLGKSPQLHSEKSEITGLKNRIKICF